MGHRALKPQKPLVSDGHQKSVIFERCGLSQAHRFWGLQKPQNSRRSEGYQNLKILKSKISESCQSHRL